MIDKPQFVLEFQFQLRTVNPAHWDPAHLESRYPANELDSGCLDLAIWRKFWIQLFGDSVHLWVELVYQLVRSNHLESSPFAD